MALISCPECGAQVSDQARSCPQCAYPLKNQDLMQQQKVDSLAVQQVQPSPQVDAYELGKKIAAPIVEQQKKASSGGATGALIGAALGYFLMASSCGMPETIETFTMSLFFWSPVVIIGMLIGYFLGKAL
jgi:hypothetical protein